MRPRISLILPEWRENEKEKNPTELKHTMTIANKVRRGHTTMTILCEVSNIKWTWAQYFFFFFFLFSHLFAFCNIVLAAPPAILPTHMRIFDHCTTDLLLLYGWLKEITSTTTASPKLFRNFRTLVFALRSYNDFNHHFESGCGLKNIQTLKQMCHRSVLNSAGVLLKLI